MLAVLAPTPPAPATVSDLERLEGHLLALPQVAHTVVNRFASGLYGREAILPAGAVCIGHEHTGEHLCMVLAGRAVLVMPGQPRREIKAGDVFTGRAGSRKLVHVVEELRFITVHANPDNCQDLDTLEARHVRKSDTFEVVELLAKIGRASA